MKNLLGKHVPKRKQQSLISQLIENTSTHEIFEKAEKFQNKKKAVTSFTVTRKH